MRIIVTQPRNDGRMDEEPRARVPDPDSVEEQGGGGEPPPVHKKKKKNAGPNSPKETGSMISAENSSKILDLVGQFHSFAKALAHEHGFVIHRMADDGNCLFRSVAHQVFGDPELHDIVRERCLDYMEKERDHYSQFITEDFEHYVARKRRDRVYGNNTEIQAMGELFNRPIEMWTYQSGALEVVNLFHGQYKTDNAPIRLSYHNGNHYNSVIDPKNPSVGVGLGLPDLKPGLADKMQIEQAMDQSVDDEIVAESRKMSEMEQAQAEMEAAAIAQSMQDADLVQQQIEEAIMEQSRKEFFQQKGWQL